MPKIVSYGQCKSCHNYVQSAAQQQANGNICKLVKGKVANCEQIDPKNETICTFCRTDYYTDKGNCSICASNLRQSAGCKRCDSTKCLECLDGFSLTDGRCTKCAMATTNSAMYSFVTTRCENCLNSTNFKDCKHCAIGWTSNTTDRNSQLLMSTFKGKVGEVCSFKCGEKEYPFVDQSLIAGDFYQTNQNGRKCMKCNAACQNCAGSTIKHCTDCPAGSFLKISDPKSQIGSCEQKLPNKNLTFDIYVSNLIDEQVEQGRQRAGTYQDPFSHLSDALKKAKDLAAPYKNIVKVTINMFAGNHFSLENRFDALNIYLPMNASDIYQMNLDITLKPLLCSPSTPSNCGSDPITIYNKIRERFLLDIYSKLTLDRIVVDSADSILPFGSLCLSQKRICCKVQDQNLINSDPRKDEQCQKHFDQMKLTDNCQNGELRTMFKAIDNSNRNQYEFTTNTLVLQQSEVRNVFYGMNSLVNITQHGGNISFSDSKFTNINICGSIIKNVQGKMYNANLSNITTQYISLKEMDYINTFQTLQYSLNPQSINETGIYFPSSIRITGSQFTNINFQSSTITNIPQVTEDGGMRYQGLILSLDSFKGDIAIQDTRFENNVFKFGSCMLDEPFSLPEPDLVNNFDVVYRSSLLDEFNLTLTRYNKLQLKSLIDIRNHSYPLGLFNNTFKQNTGLKGIINLEQAYNQTSKNSFMIYGNTFQENAALIDSNVLNFRKLALPDQLTYKSAEDMKCGGLEFSSNTFLRNIGCKHTHGVMHIYCFGNSSGVIYSPELDSQYFIGSHYDESLLTQRPEDIKGNYTTHRYNGMEYKVNDLWLVFRNNQFFENFAGSQRSLVQIEGYPIFKSIKDVYRDNENWYPEAFNQFGNSVKPKVYGKQELINFEYKAESMLTVWRPLIVEISGTVFENNYVVDDNDPSVKSLKVQSHGLLIRDFAGKILLNDGVSFNKNIGPSGGSFSKFMNSSYNQVGFKSNLLGFDHHKFSSFIADSIKFQDNHLYSYNSTVNPNPNFLNLTESDFGQIFEMDVKKLEVTRNILENSDYVVELYKVNMTFTDYVLDHNQGETSKSILKITVDAYSKIGFENLTVSKNNMTLGPIIDLILDQDILPSQSSCVEANLLISNSNILENTSKFKATLFYFEDFPWLWVRFLKTNLYNNFGSVTNEIYAEKIRRLDFYQSNWNQYASNITRDFEPSTVNSAKFILMDKTDYILDVKDSDFNCNGIFDKSMIFTMNKQREWGDSSLFKIETPSDPESLFCKNDNPVIKFNFISSTFQNCNQAYRGAIFNIENGVVLQISNNTTYALNNSAIEGGFAFMQGHGTKIIIKDAITLDGQNAYFGGSFFMFDEASIELYQVIFINAQVFEGLIYMDRNAYSSLLSLEFSNNSVQDRAIISAKDYSFFDLEDTIFDTNDIIGDAGIIQQINSRNNKFYNGSTMNFEVSKVQQSFIKRVTIQNTTMLYGGNVIKIINSNLLIDSINVYKNNIFSKSGGIHMTYSNVIIQNSVFDINNELNDRFYYDAEEIYIGEDNMGGYFLIGPNSTLVSKDNQYKNARSNIGGCIAIQGFSDASFERDSFTKCSALTGGAISATDFDQLTIKNCSFENNIAFSGKGENLFAQRFHGNLIIQDSVLTSFMNSIFLDQGFDLFAKNLTMSSRSEILITTNRLDDQKYGGGFHMINMQKITEFENISMSNLTAEYGGCIYIGLDQNFRPQNYNQYLYNMTNLALFGCKATQDGGGIQLDNVRNLQIINGSILSSTAAYNGGGINFMCGDSTLDCQLLLKGVNISDNSALEGGGINSMDVLPTIESTATIYGNRAALYGNDRASFPTKLVRFIPVSGMMKEDQIADGKSDRDYFIRYFETKINSDRLTSDEEQPLAQYPILDEMAEFSIRMLIFGIQSGGMIPIQYMALLDDQNQVVTSNRGSMISITLSDVDTEIRGAMKFFSIYGVFNISGMQILTQPGQSNIIMTMTAEKRAIKTKGAEYKLEFDLQIRDCIAGEAQLQEGVNFICQRCREGTYLLEKPPPKTPVACKVCPMGKAVCAGGNEIGPVAGFWRKSHLADAFLPCMNPDSCLGLFLYPEFKNISLKGYKPTGNCKTGYYGALCSACMPRYSAVSQYTCTKCGDKTTDILKMLGIMVMAFSCIVLLIRSTLAGQMKRQTHSVFIKILMNHMQMILITSSFDMKWPKQVKDFLQSITPLMEFQRAIVAYDCFMDPRDPATIGDTEFQAGPTEFRITYYKLLIYASMPILLGMCSISVWFVILKFRSFRKRENPREAGKEMKKLYDSFISTLVILLFLMHPTITNYMMDMFNCQEFDDDRRLLTDPQIMCNVNLHKRIAVPIAAICICIWGVGIPALIYILMSKERERLDTEAAKIKYGFLYNGYKRDNYYWEIIIMYRKILCLVIYVFFSDLGIVVQALVLLILLVVFTQLNNVTRPYCTRALNEVEDFSLYTQILTIYCGLFFISSADKTSSTYNASKDFVITDKVQYMLFFTIVSSNVAFIVLWFIKFILTLRVMIKQSSESLYIIMFLCCRRDKLIKEDSKLAREAKRETIIEKIEEIQFFIKKMRDIYSKEIFYEGHDKFLKLLYHIENERKHVDLTVKRHNLYVQGAIARERKLDPTRIQEVLKNSDLVIDADHGGNNLDMEQIKKSLKKIGQFHEPEMMLRSTERRLPINIKSSMIGGSRKQLMFDDLPFASDAERFELTTPGSNVISRDRKNSITSTENIDFAPMSKIQPRSKRAPIMFPSMMSDAFSKQDDSGIALVHTRNQDQASHISQIQQILQENNDKQSKGKSGCGFESDEDKDDLKTKKKYKKPNVIDVQKDVNKSRNAKSRINYEQKERIFAEDLNNQMHVKTYMYEYFKDLVEPEADDKMSDMNMREDSPSPEKSPSPDKDSNAGRRSINQFMEQPSMHGSHLRSPENSEGKNSSRSRGLSSSRRNKPSTPQNCKHIKNDDEPQTPRHGMDLQQIKLSKPLNLLNREESSRSKASSSRRGFLKTNIDLLDQIDGSITSPKSPYPAEFPDEIPDMDSEIAKIRLDEGYRKRLRPAVNLNYSVKIEKKEINKEEQHVKIKVVEYVKPNLSKKKHKKKVQFDSGEEKSDTSSQLTLSILDSQDSNNVKLNYNREKQTQGAFVGSYSDRDSSQNVDRKRSRKSKQKIKEEPVQTPTDTEHKTEALNITKLEKDSSLKTFQTNPQFYPDKSKESLFHGKSEQTLTAQMMQHSFNQALRGETVQTIKEGQMPGALSAKNEYVFKQSTSDGANDDDDEKMLPKIKMRNKKKKLEEPNLFKLIANLESVDNESDQD